MKVFYVTEAIMNDWSAPSVHVNEICKNMARQGCTVALYLPATKVFGAITEYQTIEIKAPHKFHSLFYQPLLFARLCRDVRRDKPDMLYSRHSHLLFVPAFIGKLFNIPVILEVNEKLNTDATFNHDALSYVLRTLRILWLIEKINFSLASKLITVSEGIRENAIEAYRVPPEKVVTIANGVDADFFKPIPPAENPVKAEPGFVYVGYLGSFLAWQGLRYVAEAAKMICTKHKNVKFTIIGGGTDGPWFASFIEENKLADSVRIVPPVSHDLVPAYINTFDICLSYPLRIRGGITSPFKVYEYLSCGRAVVSADIKGMREEFGDVMAYAEPESPSALAAALMPLIEDKAKRAALGERSRKFIVEGRSWAAVTTKILGVCKETVTHA